ncbi:autotransporter-associated N-terminal domain-containing protein [Fusobacterium polymorphum]|uniref:autotransporter-associated N-terminal domain-containing protein n=1 Tax=Fusobacterium nucleatum subsp. polymorphum TaxID=76857 RepID=UPI0030CE258E
MGNNNLYKVENTLRSIAKRYKSVKYSLGLAILFLMMGVSAFSEEVVAQEAVAQQEVMTNEQIASSKDNLKDSIGNLKSKIDTARAENEKGLAGLRLELIQLMEQGNQVVKSPWMSWQFGANYMYNKWNGTYKGKGDKAEKYPFEGVFTRSENSYERYTSPDSPRHSLLATSSSPYSASTNNRGGLKGYGLEGTKTVKEPIVGFAVSAGINPRVFNAPTVTPLNATQPNLPEAINFVPPTIITPSPNPSNVSIVSVTLDSYGNGAGWTMLGKDTNIDGNYTLSQSTSGYTNAIMEYGTTGGNYFSSESSVMNVDVARKRAVTLDPTGGFTSPALQFTNKGTINLLTEEVGGIEVQTHYQNIDVLGINEGLIKGNNNKQIAMIFTDEGGSAGTYTLQNNKDIVMDGNESTGYGLKVTTGWKAVVVNNGNITMNGEKSFGIGVGTASTNMGAGSSAKNTGTININGKNSGGIAVQVDMTGGIENKGTINVSGENSFGMYSEIARPLNNDGKINITAGDSNIGLRTGNTATLVNKNEINISSTGKENIGLYASSGTVTNDAAGKVKITAGENIGIMSAGTGTANNEGTITVTSDGSTGAIATGGTVNNKGTISVTGNTSSSGRGAAGIVASGGTFTATGTGTITANVTGKNSVGIYAKNGTATVLQNNTDTANGAVNYAVDTNGTINLNGAGTANTGASALLFYNDGGKINLGSPLIANISGGSNTPATRGTAFLYKGTGYSSFTDTDISTWAKNKFGNGTTTSLNNLTLNMAPGSRLFIASDVSMNLSNTAGSTLSSALGATINGSGYKTFMLYNSLLRLDQAIDLDNANDSYNQLELSNSSIDNNNSNTITGTQAGQTAIAQENLLTNRAAVTLNNNGAINLSGSTSTAMYAKFGIINNNATGTISLGDTSTGLYGIADSILTNTGTITMGSSSTAMYSEGSTTQGVTNAGTITSTGTTSVGVLFKPDATLGAGLTLGNTGTITLGDSSVGLYGSNTATNYTTSNSGKVTVGNNGIAMFGYASDVTAGTITVGDKGVGVYSQGGNVNLTGGTITTGASEAVGVYTVGNAQTITNSGTSFNLGNTSVAIANAGTGNTINSTVGNANLGTGNIYIYSNDTTGNINNSTNLTSTNDGNYGIYSAGTVTNTGNLNFGTGIGNVGIYSIRGGRATNTGAITIGASNPASNLYSIGMAAGYSTTDTGTIINNGTINVNGEYSLGMYASGAGSVARNNSNIVLNANNTTGIYADNGATVINTGNISTGPGTYSNVVGVYLGQGSTLNNTGSITINGTKGIGVYLKGGTIVNRGNITVNGSNDPTDTDYTFTTPPTGKAVGGAAIDAPQGATSATVTINGISQTPVNIHTFAKNPITVSASSIGLYVNTSGVDYTNVINGLGNLTSEADLIIGTEATEMTNSKSIVINDPQILNPYNNAIRTSGVADWKIYSGGLTWLATPTLNSADGTMTNIYMVKIPYTAWAANKATPVEVTDTYNFLDGLEQRYGVEELGSRERQLFSKLNGIGKNEEVLFRQATDEMMGHQYANVQQRINATGNILDKEFDYLRGEWQTASKDSNKIKTFGTRGDYKTDTAGIIDYKYNAYGVAYVHENEDIKLGRGIGWYAGIVHNRIKFKDIGGSKEDQLQGKVGLYKSVPFDDNNSLNWTISGDIFVGRNRMHRRFLVVDEVFHAKSRYYNYGISIKNEIGKEFRLSESFTLRPYAALDLEYGRISKIREKSGEIKLEVKQNHYISVKPEIGAELAFKQYFGRKTLKVGLGVAYENELGRVAKGKNKARVADTTADWFNIRSEKEDRRGNVKFDLNLGLDNQRVGVTGNVGYDTKGQNVRGGLGLRVIF